MNSNGKSISLPKLNTASVDDFLYIKKQGALARLVPGSVALQDEKDPLLKSKPKAVEAPKSKAVEVLKPTQEEPKKMSRKERQMEREKTAGKGWFDMGKPEMTPELKRDLQVLKMRHVLDPKRHYKKMDKKSEPKYFQVGTIIEGPTEFFSARLTKKERKQTIVEELLADEESRQYYKRKHLEAQEKGRNGRKRPKHQIKKASRK